MKTEQKRALRRAYYYTQKGDPCEAIAEIDAAGPWREWGQEVARIRDELDIGSPDVAELLMETLIHDAGASHV